MKYITLFNRFVNCLAALPHIWFLRYELNNVQGQGVKNQEDCQNFIVTVKDISGIKSNHPPVKLVSPNIRTYVVLQTRPPFLPSLFDIQIQN